MALCERGLRHVFVSLHIVYMCIWVCVWRCVWRIPGALPYHPVPKSCVKAVSNKLLNLIKRSGIILQSHRALGPLLSCIHFA